jgi:hypothetical protein
MRLDTKRRVWVIVATAIVLYGLSELSGYLKENWFSTEPSIVISGNGTIAFRISDQGQLQTTILKPTVEIKSAELIDCRNHPHFHSQKYPFLYTIDFNFDVINGIENKQNLVLTRVIAVLDVNDGKSKVIADLKYDEIIYPETVKHISTNTDKPIFLGYTEEIMSCKLRIQCIFNKFHELESKEFAVSIK